MLASLTPSRVGPAPDRGSIDAIPFDAPTITFQLDHPLIIVAIEVTQLLLASPHIQLENYFQSQESPGNARCPTQGRQRCGVKRLSDSEGNSSGSEVRLLFGG